MRISWSQLYHLPVYTRSNEKIGMVEGVTIDIDAHNVVHYEVKPALRLAALFTRPLLISPGQIVSISKDRMIVEDSVTAEQPATTDEKTRLAKSSPAAPAQSGK